LRETAALKWEDIDEAKGLIRVSRGNWKGQEITSTKTRKRRTVPLDPEVADVLRVYRQRLVAAQHPGLATGWVFPARNGGLHRSYPLRRVLQVALKESGIDRRVTVHGLRHTANDLLRRVASAEVVRSIVGHSTARMTEHYSHVDAGEKQAALSRMLRLVRPSAPTSDLAKSGPESGPALLDRTPVLQIVE
jgi:integrase